MEDALPSRERCGSIVDSAFARTRFSVRWILDPAESRCPLNHGLAERGDLLFIRPLSGRLSRGARQNDPDAARLCGHRSLRATVAAALIDDAGSLNSFGGCTQRAGLNNTGFHLGVIKSREITRIAVTRAERRDQRYFVASRPPVWAQPGPSAVPKESRSNLRT